MSILSALNCLANPSKSIQMGILNGNNSLNGQGQNDISDKHRSGGGGGNRSGGGGNRSGGGGRGNNVDIDIDVNVVNK